MTDLHERFRSLDRISTPDLWWEATQRAAVPAAGALGGREWLRNRSSAVVPIALVTIVLVAAFVGFGLFTGSGIGNITGEPQPFHGTWVSTSDADGGMQTMTVQGSADDAVEITVRDDIATVCGGTSSTMTGTGRIADGTQLVIPAPVYACDDGSEPEALSGPPLEEQLRDWTLVLDPQTDTLSDGGGGVWVREGVEAPSPEPTPAGAMWPQTSRDEVNEAQELADAGDPAYTWQVDPQLTGDAAPWGAEILDRFLREVLGWEEFNNSSGYAYGDSGGLYTELVFFRCAPGRTNPLYPDDPQGRGCAPTLDDFRYETVMLTVEQPARRDPSGIWVVTEWEMLQSGEPSSLFDHLYPDFTGRQVEQVAPPTDAEATALLQSFLEARVDGEGAEQYLHSHDGEEPPSTVESVPVLLYATTGGAPYERFEVDLLQGPEWPSGWIDSMIRLIAEDGTVVEQSFAVIRQEDGRLGLVYGFPQANEFPTTENGQAVPLPYSALDGEVTFDAAPPWGYTFHDRTSTTLGGVGRGSASQFTMFTVVADPLTGVGCEAGPAPADAEALVRSIRSNPDLEATDPVAVSVGGIDAVLMDVVAPGQLEVGDCMPIVLEHLSLGPDGRMRLYLLDLPDGMSARVLAISISALDTEFEHVVEAATPVLDSFEFHTP